MSGFKVTQRGGGSEALLPVPEGRKKPSLRRVKTVNVSLKQFVFYCLFRDARAVLRYHLCSSFSLEKKLIVTLFYSPSFKTIMLTH